jgi:hypothetical protein
MEQRSRWKVSGAGYGIHWPDIDEDLSTEGLLRGAPAAAEPARLGRQAIRVDRPTSRYVMARSCGAAGDIIKSAAPRE